jgi:hypothetical protein
MAQSLAGYSFFVLLAAAMMRIPSAKEKMKLRRAFPYIFDSLQRRLWEVDGYVEEWDG